MKSTQLLSVILSMILVLGVTADPVFAQTDEDYDDDTDEIEDKSYEKHIDLKDRLEQFCEMADEEKKILFADHPRLAEFEDRLANYCDLSEEEQDVIDDLIESHGDKIRAEIKDYADGYHKDVIPEMREKLENYCQMSDAEKTDYIAEHDKSEEHVEKMNSYCTLDEDAKQDFIEEHRDEYKAHMKEKMSEKKHIDYQKLCEMSTTERAAEIDDAEKLERISNWCEMTPEEREEYKKEHHDSMKDKHDFDGISDVAKERMSDVAKAKLSENSERLKAMIMSKHNISDERRDEIKMKYVEKHGEITDKIKSELKMKFKNHMASMKVSMSEDRRTEIQDRVAEMKAFKAELRERSSDLTDEEKQQLREEFIEKAKDMQLAWITPRVQIAAGVDSAEVECREGYSLVMKASNGVPMCLKADTALKMIDRGIVVPAN